MQFILMSGLCGLELIAAGVLADWSLPALFVIAGAVLAGTSTLAVFGKAAREID